MRIRQCLALVGISFCMATSTAWAEIPRLSDTAAEPLVSQVFRRSILSDRARLFLGIPYWLVGVSLATGTLVAFIWLHLYQQQRRWQRVNLARREVKAFQSREDIQHVLDILDYEEFRTFCVTQPKTGKQLCFEANDYRLRRALRSHDQMEKTRCGLDEINRLAAKNHPINPQALTLVQKYEEEEFFIELTLRNWFDAFLDGLEYFEDLIGSGLITAEELKPFIIYWIKLIGDRRYRRKGGSGFYDQLFDYIHWSGYSGVKSLFERYGFKLIPPPYSSHDFTDVGQEPEHDTHRALDLAKAAQLVYEDKAYVADIVRLWLGEDRDQLWKTMSNRQYVISVIKNWLQEGTPKGQNDIYQNFVYLDRSTTDTQSFLFRDGNNIVLVFRGSQQLADWKTNLKIRLKQFTILADQTCIPPKGRVHRGFLEAWQSIEHEVGTHLKKWWTPETKLWITGHSLGGALAAMATLSLDAQGFTISGLYTFGQPRIADWKMVNYINGKLGDRIFRYANNNDVVPMIPPQIIPWVPTRVYGHLGQFRYFNHRGNLRYQSWLLQRLPDRLLGLLKSLIVAGTPDAIDDHKMEFYIANLQKALNQEQEMAKLEQEKRLIRGEVMEEVRERLRRKQNNSPDR